MYADDSSRPDFLFDGMPAVLKFHSGETVIATVHEDEEQGIYYLDRPVAYSVIYMEREGPEGVVRKELQPKVRFVRWVRESAAIVFPISVDAVMHVTLCTETITSLYWKNADILYSPLVEEERRREEREVLAQMDAEEAEDDTSTFLFLTPDPTWSDDRIQAHNWGLLLAKMPKTMQPN